jgi:hypothetical protein
MSLLYPFTIRHLGRDSFTLFASSAEEREKWTDALLRAKSKYVKAFEDAKPFNLRVIADSAFAYGADDVAKIHTARPVVSGTPLDRAICQVEKLCGPGRLPPPLSTAPASCATAFEANGRSYIAVGTDLGIYVSEAANPRGWTRTVQMTGVTQIAAVQDLAICVLLAGQSLLCMPLDIIAPPPSAPGPARTRPQSPALLAKEVQFFAISVMNSSTLLFYKAKTGDSSVVKILKWAPPLAAEKRRPRLFGNRKGDPVGFLAHDEFYVDCHSLNVFQTHIAVASSEGFKIVTLEKKDPVSLPVDLYAPSSREISQKIQGQDPLGMFKITDGDFLLVYSGCAIYVNKHGELNQTPVMEFVGQKVKAERAAVFGAYLLLFYNDFVEVRNHTTGRLRQVITGHNIRCLDYGFRGPTGTGAQPGGQDSKGTVKMCMSHPEVMDRQIVLELILEDGNE